jgi:hypothetical protein
VHPHINLVLLDTRPSSNHGEGNKRKLHVLEELQIRWLMNGIGSLAPDLHSVIAERMQLSSPPVSRRNLGTLAVHGLGHSGTSHPNHS